jgi:hypothetical protein
MLFRYKDNKSGQKVYRCYVTVLVLDLYIFTCSFQFWFKSVVSRRDFDHTCPCCNGNRLRKRVETHRILHHILRFFNFLTISLFYDEKCRLIVRVFITLLYLLCVMCAWLQTFLQR